MPQYTTTTGIFGTTTGGGLYDDTWWRTFGEFSLALAACGLVKTADTGQVDWATSTPPSTNNITQRYEIWRLDDFLQATEPVFLKVAYCLNAPFASTHRNPYVTITIGTGSDGVGNLTGALGAPMSIRMSTSNSGGSWRDWYFTGDGSGFAGIVGGNNTGTSRYWFAIERLRGDAGEFLTYRVALVTYGYVEPEVASQGLSLKSQVYDFENSRAYFRDGFQAPRPAGAAGTSATWGTLIVTGEVYPFVVPMVPMNNGTLAQMKLTLGYCQFDFPRDMSFSVERFTNDEVLSYQVIRPATALTTYYGAGATEASVLDEVSKYVIPALYKDS